MLALAVIVLRRLLCVLLIALLVERFCSILAPGKRGSQDDHESENCKKSQSVHFELPRSWI